MTRGRHKEGQIGDSPVVRGRGWRALRAGAEQQRGRAAAADMVLTRLKSRRDHQRSSKRRSDAQVRLGMRARPPGSCPAAGRQPQHEREQCSGATERQQRTMARARLESKRDRRRHTVGRSEMHSHDQERRSAHLDASARAAGRMEMLKCWRPQGQRTRHRPEPRFKEWHQPAHWHQRATRWRALLPGTHWRSAPRSARAGQGRPGIVRSQVEV